MKKFLTLATLFIVSQAQALETLEGAFHLDCRGSQGSLSFSRESDQAAINYEVHAVGQNLKGSVQPYLETGDNWEEGSVYIIDPDNNTKKWLSLAASHGVKAWRPEHEECMPTRVENQCFKHTVPGYYFNKLTAWVDVMVDFSNPSHVVFDRIDMGSLGETKTLGPDTSCTFTN